MGFYIRKAFRAGPIRFNLSKSGIGVSAGVTGARIGLSSSGRAYVHGGRHGIYYRKTLGGGSRRRSAEGAAAGGGTAGLLAEPVGGPIEVTEETGVTYAAFREPQAAPPEASVPVRTLPSTHLPLFAIAILGGLLLPAPLPWVVAAAGVAGGIAAVSVRGKKTAAGDAYGRALDLWLPGPLTDEALAHLAAARGERWLTADDARYFEQRAWLALLETTMAGAADDPDSLERVAAAEQAVDLDPAFTRRAKLDTFRRAHVEATADHDLDADEEAALQRTQAAFGLSDEDVEEELALIERLREMRAIRDGELPRVKSGARLRSGEVCHLECEGRLLKKRILRSFSHQRQKYKVRGFIIDKAGQLLVTSKRVLLRHAGTTSFAIDSILDVEIDADRQLLTVTRDGRVRPTYLTTPDAMRTGAVIAALAGC